MATAALEILVKLRDEASAQLKAMNTAIESNTKAWKENYGALADLSKQAGMAMSIMGVAITGVLALATNAALDQRKSIMQLEAALNNLGLGYANVKGEIEPTISAMMHLTGVGAEKQRAALAQLIMITRNYDYALSLLPLALDWAAAKHMDLVSAAELVGRVALGNTARLSLYGIELRQGASAADALAAMQRMVGGSAIAMANPIDILTQTLNELAGTVGIAILPALFALVQAVTPIIENISAWIVANPALANSLILAAGALGVILLAAGALLMIMPGLIAAFVGLTAVGAPALLILGGIAAAILAVAGGVGAWAYFSAPSMQYGGIVPGPIGRPVPIIAHGGEHFLGIGGGGGNINVDVKVYGSVTSERDLAATIRREVLKIKDRNLTAGLT